jgi:hypothetical protein
VSERFDAVVVYYAEPKLELLRDVLLPEILDWARDDAVEAAYLQRHWRRGPHVRLCVRAADAQAARLRARDGLAVVAAHLAARPSGAPLDPVAYLERSRDLAELELRPDPLEPLWPDNRVFLEPAEDDTARFGGDEAFAFREDFLARAMAPVRQLLDAARERPALVPTYVLHIFVVLAASYPSGIGYGYLSFRSHLEDFLDDRDGEGAMRAAFAQRFEPARDAVRRQVEALLDELGDDGRGPLADPVLATWQELFGWAWERARELAGRGVLTEDPAPLLSPIAHVLGGRAARRWTFDDARGKSDFHERLGDLDFLPERVNVQRFAAYRWLVNLTYALLPLLGMSPAERYYLSHVLSETVEEMTGRGWQERIGEIVDQWGGKA